MDPESNADAPSASSDRPVTSPPPSRAAALAPTLAVLAVAAAALAAAVMTTRPDTTPAVEHRTAVAPPPRQEVVRAPPLNSMGAGPACNACGVVESVTAAKASKSFQMRIRMDDGSLRTVEQRGAMAAGTRVVVDGVTVKLMPGPG